MYDYPNPTQQFHFSLAASFYADMRPAPRPGPRLRDYPGEAFPSASVQAWKNGKNGASLSKEHKRQEVDQGKSSAIGL